MAPRQAPLPDGLRFYDLRHTCGQLSHRPGREHQGGAGAARACDREHHARQLTGICSRPRLMPSRIAWNWSGMPPRRSGDGPRTDPRTTAEAEPQADDRIPWRRLRGSNPRGSCPPTRFPGVCLRPLGQASAGQSSQPRHPPATGRCGKDGIRTHGRLATSTVFELCDGHPWLPPVLPPPPAQRQFWPGRG
jgi:hypothetical protein